MPYRVRSDWSQHARAAHYGDGVFTTMKVVSGQVALLDYHIKRIQQDTHRLGLPQPDNTLWQHVQHSAGELQHGVLKLVLHAGEGGRGYQRPEELSPEALLFTSNIPGHYERWQQQGIHLGVSPISLAAQPALAGIKHLNRLEQVLIKKALAATDYDDMLVTDTDGNVIECSSANVFFLGQDNVWQTPALDTCGVAGVMRQCLIDYLEKRQLIHIAPISIEQALNAQAAIMTNALMGIVPIASLAMDDTQSSYALQPVLQLAAELP